MCLIVLALRLILRIFNVNLAEQGNQVCVVTGPFYNPQWKNFRKMQSDMFPGAVEKGTRQVMIYPLSQLIDPASIPSASLLKIDVQGYELDVLQAVKILFRNFRTSILNVHSLNCMLVRR
jgi:FkbM family methyltransferase